MILLNFLYEILTPNRGKGKHFMKKPVNMAKLLN